MVHGILRLGKPVSGASRSCHQYTELTDGRRSTAYSAKDVDDLLCDRDLKEGWYRLMTGTGNMPTKAVGHYKRGTVFPVWYNGK